MRSEFDELKRFAIADILSVSGRQKTTETVDMHINTIIDIAFLKGQQESQSKVDELQRRNQMLNDNIKEQGQKLVYQNEVIETQAEKLIDLRDEKAELQKRVDAAHDALTELKEKSEALHHRWHIFSDSVALAEAEMIDMCVKEIEQALKGGEA